MDDLDREIEQAQQAARQRVRRRQLATLASTATFLLVGAASAFVIFTVFPEDAGSELDAELARQKVEHEDPSAQSVAKGFGAMRRDQGSMRWKIIPVGLLAFVSANFVRKRLTPPE